MLYIEVCYFFFAEPPSLTARPQRKIFADLDRNIDIPCQATGNTVHTFLSLEHAPTGKLDTGRCA